MSSGGNGSDRKASILLVFALVAALIPYAPIPVRAATFTVDSTGDQPDTDPGDGSCDVGDGLCTLRAAIQESNALAGADTIAFNIDGGGPHLIQPASDLPQISGQLTIDGSTQPEGGVVLDGSEIDGSTGLSLATGSDGSAILGLEIRNFPGPGIGIFGTSTGNFIAGNVIHNNGNDGIQVQTDRNTIGGEDAQLNVIYGNANAGVQLAGDANIVFNNQIGTLDGLEPAPNGTGVHVTGADNLIDRNLISGNSHVGIEVSGETATGNRITRNHVGTDVVDLGGGSGGALPNGTGDGGLGGVIIQAGASSNFIGLPEQEIPEEWAGHAGNTISGNAVAGITISGAHGNEVIGNGVGTDWSRSLAIANSGPGIRLLSANSNQITDNTIGGNGGNGVLISGGGSNTLSANYIGITASGDAALANAGNGVQIIDSANNTIGGATDSARNVISGNGGEGVRVDGASATNNRIEDNYIGTSADGLEDLGNSLSGVYLRRAPGNLVLGNVISGNGGFAGIAICGDPGFCGGGDPPGSEPSNAAGNIVQANWVGMDGTGSGALGNTQRGVSIDGAPSTEISDNVIANNGQAGVRIVGNDAVGNQIVQNQIHSNGGLGIDLATIGVTPNDEGDGDTGPNNLINFPVLSAESGGVAASFDGETALGGTTVTIELFSVAECDSSGFGEGDTFVASQSVSADDNGDVLVTFAHLAEGIYTATTTDASGNTSEFSECVTVEAVSFSEDLYGVDSSSDSLNVIDPATGSVTVVGPLDPDPEIYTTPIAMAVQPDTGDLYVWNNTNGSTNDTLVSTGVLLTLDRCTGLAAPVDPETDPQGQLGALAFAPDGTLFGLDSSLYAVDPVTGVRTEIGGFDGVQIGAADFAPDGTLYGVELVAGAPERLFTIDTATGTLTAVGTLSSDVGTIGSIVFAPDGTLLGSAGTQLFEIDPATATVSGSIALTAFAPQGMGFSAPCDVLGSVVVESVDVGEDTTLEAGYAVPLAEIPPERLLVGATTIAGAPMAAIELNASPMAAIPMAAIPMAAIGGDSALGQTLLSEIPIEGGWEPLLVGTSFEGRPLQTLTLGEVAAEIDPLALLRLNLGSLRLGNTGLSDLSLASILLGDVPLDELCSGCPPDSALDLETSGAGIAAVPMGAIPMAAIPMGAIGDLASAPMGAIPMAAIPMGAIPLGAIGDITASPLAAIPMGAIANLAVFPMAAIDATGIPMAAIPMAAIPMGAIPLAAIDLGAVLADVPIGAIGGGCGGSVDCSFPGVDDSTTVAEYLVATGSSDIASSPMAAIPMGAIPMGAIALGEIPMAAIPMAAIPLAELATTSTPMGAIPMGAIATATGVDGCADPNAPSVCDASTTLKEFAAGYNGSTLEGTPMGAIELGQLPMAAIPMAAIDLDAIEIAGVPMAAIEIDSIDLINSPMGAIPMAAIPSTVICGDAGSAQNLLQLAAVGALCDGATLGDLGDALDGLTLGDVLNHLTLGFLGQILEIGGLTFGELVVSILLALDFPWEDLPLDQIETRDVACGFDRSARECLRGDQRSQADLGEPDIADVSVVFTVSDGPVVGEVVEVTIPEGWVILPGSAQVSKQSGEAGPPFRVADPRDEGDDLFTFTVPQIGVGEYTLQFAVAAGFDLGQNLVITAEEVSGGDDIVIESLVSSVAMSVVEGLEFGDLVTSARDLDPDTLWVGYINRERDEDWWRVEAPDPGFRVAVYLSNLAGDVDTFVYRPATAPLGGDGSERDIPLPIAPFDDDDVDLSGGGTLSPELLGDSALKDLSGSVLGDGSANRGAADEFAEFFSRPGDTDDTSNDRYTIQVAGFQGATSESPYVLRVRYRSEVPTPACDAREGVGPVGGAAPAIPNNVDTIFLVNWDRMEDMYPGEVAALQSQLQSFASSNVGGVPVNGVVVPIGSIPGVSSAFAAWDDNPCDASAANDIADLVVSYIQGVASTHPTLRHVSIIGGDEVVPFARLEDEAIVANESTYTEGFANNALYGAHFTRHYLSDAPYGDLDPIPWLDRFAYIKDLGVGRLVESPGDISGAISTFEANNGVLDPNTTATAGYDFLTDGAEAVRSNLGGLNELTGAGQLISETWTATQLGDIAYGASGGSAADVISPNAHYDHHRLLPASENATQTENDLFTITQLEGVSVPNRIVFTMGCHSGLSVDDKAGGTIGQPTDWAQVYGAQQAVYIGNTGYGYGDTATVALSEQMMANVADGLGNGQTIAQNLSQAGQDQFGKAGLYGVYDLKAIEEATLYGLPMWRVNVSGRSPIASNGSDTGPVLPDSQTGLLAASFSKSPEFEPKTSPDGDYFTADGGTQFMHWRPITPKTGVNATQEGLIATGAVLTNLVSRDVPLANAVFARPNTTDLAGREPEVEFEDVIFPTTFATLGTFELLNPDRSEGPVLRQQILNLLAGQYVGTNETQRLFDQMNGQIYYALEGSDVDWTPPNILDVEANVSGPDVGFLVTADDLDSGVSRVVVLYRSSESGGVSDWTALDLVPLGDGRWAGGGTTEIGQPDYIVQVLNGDGVSDVAVFKGDFYQAKEIAGDDPNQPPEVGPITAPTDPVQIGTTVNTSAEVSDENLGAATITWSWDDGATSLGTISNGTVTGSHVYTQPGVYRVRLVVVDDGGLVGESFFEFVVAYDPEGGFVTGAGWIDSPPGAYTPDPSLTGKATFGFVSKYQKGKTVPEGNTTFKFNTANLDFRSTEYEWLVISGEHKAQYKGSGTINGGGAYKFILTAIDAENTSSTETDLFRIKIWWEDETGNEHVVYDNELGATDNADPTTEIAGGSIVIHSGKSSGPK